jgi:hypothetical protein
MPLLHHKQLQISTLSTKRRTRVFLQAARVVKESAQQVLSVWLPVEESLLPKPVIKHELLVCRSVQLL